MSNGKRQIAAEQTRIKLIQTAKKLIKEEDFNHFKIKDITNEAGVSVGTFYTYFKTKEDIISEASNTIFNKIRYESLSGETTYEKVKYFLIKSVKEIEETGLQNCKIWLSNAIRLRNEEDNTGEKKLYFDLDIIIEILKLSGLEEKNKEDLQRLGLEILAEYYGSLTLWCITDGTITPLSLIDKFCEFEFKKLLESY